MPSPGATYDPQAIAQDVRAQLDQHRDQVARTVATPASTPMFTTEASGALVDRAGRVVVPAPKSLPA